jgi:hypothetical protein
MIRPLRPAVLVLVLALPLAACGLPDPRDGLTETGTARANGHEYRVNWNPRVAQVTRTNPTWRPDFAEVALGAVRAAEAVTGCRVRPASLTGDVSLIEVTLDCPEA